MAEPRPFTSKMQSDAELVAELTTGHCNSALAELIRRHGRFVERTAQRLVGNIQLAEDISQAVFLILLKKASTIHRDESIAGWLHHTAVFIARDAVRAEARRRRREREAQEHMHHQQQQKVELPDGFDRALERLSKSDRQAIELRYLESREMAPLAAELGLSEQTLQRRISRAVERLRDILAGSVAGLSLAMLSEMLEHEAGAALAALPSLTPTALASAGMKSTAIAQGALKTMFWTKIKTIAASFCAVAALTAGGIVAVRAVAAETQAKAEVTKTKAQGRKRSGPLADLPSK